MNRPPEILAIGPQRPRFGRFQSWIVYSLIFGWLWFWRSGVFSGGDSEQWTRMIDGGVWFQENQPLPFLLVQLVFRVIHTAFGGTAQMAFGIVSCVAGVVSAALVVKLLEGYEARPWRLAMVMTAGFTTIFYGHLETYATPAAALFFHFLCIKRSREDAGSIVAIPLSYALLLASHLLALFVFPAMLAVTLLEARRRAVAPPQALRLALAFVLIGVVWFLISRIGDGKSYHSSSYVLRTLGRFVSNPVETLPRFELLLKARFAFWNGGIASLALLVFLPSWRDPLARLWGLYFACFIGFTILWRADRGITDFDLHAFPWIVATLLAAILWKPGPAARVLAVAILLVNAGLWSTRTLVYADLGNRGSATVFVRDESGGEDAILLLDERLALRARNRFISPGAHTITRIGPGGAERLEIHLEKGRRYLLRVENGQLAFEAIDGEPGSPSSG
jgi:hypothetical protein